jgi:GNAT superfamily N-acetyltransferase
MTSVLHFRKHLAAPPVAAVVPGFHVRTFQVPVDVPAWLQLHDRAMAGELPAARPWSAADFQADIGSKSWWRPDRSWVAMPDDAFRKPVLICGAVTLALREGTTQTVPVVHWLLVDPAFRRRGVAHSLMSHLERAAWDDGWREVRLETHAGWSAAVAFYQSIGYAPL